MNASGAWSTRTAFSKRTANDKLAAPPDTDPVRSPLHDVRQHAPPAHTQTDAKLLIFRTNRPKHHAMRKHPVMQTPCDGGARRDRTDDLMLAKHALSQLSYGPFSIKTRITPKARLPNSTPTQDAPRKGVPGMWWAWEDLNLRPHAYQARALTN
jgi:hypothetical protein